MKGGTSAAAVSVRYLEQGIELIRRLDDEQFTGAPGSPFPGGVAPSTLRHWRESGIQAP